MDDHELMVTIDIEDWYHIPSVCGSPFSVYPSVEEFFKAWKEKYDYLTAPTYNILDILDELRIRATFFVVSDVTDKYPGLVESIAARGHEIACHGLHHACKIDPVTKKPLMTRDEFEERTLKAKRQLESALGDNVLGYRAPNAMVGGWMIDSLERLGFSYDSSVSVNSFYNKTDSALVGVSSSPYRPKIGGLEPDHSRGFIEFPWAYWDIAGRKLPSSGGPALRFLGERVVLNGLRQSLKRGPTVFYFHPIDISNERFPAMGKGRPLYWMIKGTLIEKKIRHILKRLLDENVKMKCMRELA